MAGRVMAAVLLLLLLPASAGAQSVDDPVQVVTETQGVRIVMTVPHRVYPQNALVPVTVRIDNLSPSPVSPVPPCEGDNAGVQVLASDGRLVYPVPDQVPTDPGHCPPGFGPAIAPGQSRENQFLVILRGSVVRVYWSFWFASVGHTDVHLLVGKPAVLRLVPGQAPSTRLQTVPQVTAQVQRPPRAVGPLWYIQMAKCTVPNTKSVQVDYAQVWQSTPGTQLDPPCADPLEWHVAAGWIGEPVATIDYVRPGGLLPPTQLRTNAALYRLVGRHWQPSHVLHLGDLARFRLVMTWLGPSPPAPLGRLVIVRAMTSTAIGSPSSPAPHTLVKQANLRRVGIGLNTWRFSADIRFRGRRAVGKCIAHFLIPNEGGVIGPTLHFSVKRK